MDAASKSFIPYDEAHHFPLENIPFGVFKHPQTGKLTCCTRIGDQLVDLQKLFPHLQKAGPKFGGLQKNPFDGDNLNEFADLGTEFRVEARNSIQALFAFNSEAKDALSECLVAWSANIEFGMPMFIRDYTDFYSSKNHAYNIGVMFRGPDNALQPNWVHLPVGYHGRASSVVISGTPITRPRG